MSRVGARWDVLQRHHDSSLMHKVSHVVSAPQSSRLLRPVLVDESAHLWDIRRGRGLEPHVRVMYINASTFGVGIADRSIAYSLPLLLFGMGMFQMVRPVGATWQVGSLACRANLRNLESTCKGGRMWFLTFARPAVPLSLIRSRLSLGRLPTLSVTSGPRLCLHYLSECVECLLLETRMFSRVCQCSGEGCRDIPTM